MKLLTFEDLAVKCAFDEVLEGILLNKPEHIVNPYRYSRNQNRTHNVSDLIDSLNKKIDNCDLIQDEFVDLDSDSDFLQLVFDF